MAKPKKSKKLMNSQKIDQKPLTNSFLTVNTIIENTRGTYTEFTCCVENYSSLEQDVAYILKHKIYSHWWAIHFLKAHNFLIVALNTNIIIKDVSFWLCSSEGKIMKSTRSGDLKRRMPYAKFHEKKISNPENLLLMNDALISQFAYSTRPSEYNILLSRDMQEKTAESIHSLDVFELCNDLKHLYLNSSFSNFTIVAGDVAFKVHRLIISLRSHYFAELFRTNPDLVSDNIDAYPGIVHEVLLYIYSAELRNMEFTHMIEIFYIACNWQITTLVQICIDYFKGNFTADNVLKILHRAYQYNVPALVPVVLNFIRNLPQYLKETAVWSEIKLEACRLSGSRNL